MTSQPSQPIIFASFITANNYTLIDFNIGHQVKLGKYAGKYFNPYALVKDNVTNEQFYICHANGDNDTECVFKFEAGSLNKVLRFDADSTVSPSWYLMLNGYIATTVKGKIRYLHQHIMDYHGQQSVESGLNPELSVDHINKNKLDNRLSNLRLATQREQNMNTDRVYVRTITLPAGCLFTVADMPKLIQYKPEKVYSGATHGQHFIIEVKLPVTGTKIIKKTTKRADRTIYYKLIQAVKLRYNLMVEHPQLWPSLDITGLEMLQGPFLDEQRTLITRIAGMDIIPRDSAELLDMTKLEFPHEVDVSAQIAELDMAFNRMLDDEIDKIIPKDQQCTDPMRMACPSCGNIIVAKTLKRHATKYCPNREITQEQQAELDEKKRIHYARVSASKIKNSARKLSDADILLIRESSSQGMTHQVIADRFKLSRQYISDVINGRIKLKVEAGHPAE